MLCISACARSATVANSPRLVFQALYPYATPMTMTSLSLKRLHFHDSLDASPHAVCTLNQVHHLRCISIRRISHAVSISDAEQHAPLCIAETSLSSRFCRRATHNALLRSPRNISTLSYPTLAILWACLITLFILFRFSHTPIPPLVCFAKDTTTLLVLPRSLLAFLVPPVHHYSPRIPVHSLAPFYLAITGIIPGARGRCRLLDRRIS